MKIITWNVNGLRAIMKKGFEDWLCSFSPDIVCIQETKISKDKINEVNLKRCNYHTYYSCAQKKGYSGVAIFSKEKLSVFDSFADGQFDDEGRLIGSELKDFILLNVYFPNGGRSEERLAYKLRFYDAFLSYIKDLAASKKNIIFCGDINTAHKPIDLARPKENESVSGFLPIEREWIDRVIESGFVDLFRHFNKDPGQYTWWDYKTRARQRNVGWRLDYFFANAEYLENIIKTGILSEIHGSDHCPVVLEL